MTQKASDTLRLPMQVGTSALRALARVAVKFGAVAAVPTLIALLLLSGGSLAAALVAGVAVSAVGVLFSFADLTLVWKWRASDVLLDREGLRLVGGAFDGRRVSWRDTDPKLWELTRVPFFGGAASFTTLFGRGGGREISLLRLPRTDDAGDVIAVAAETEAEGESLRSVLESLRGAAGAPPEAGADIVSLVTCATCGAALGLPAIQVGRCDACAAAVTASPEVAARIEELRASATSGAALDGIAARLLEQPGPGVTNAILLFAFTVALGSWPLSLVAMHELEAEYVPTPAHRLVLVVALSVWPLLLIATAYALARLLVANRGALQLLTLQLAAVVPTDGAMAPRCRMCLAVLDDTGKSVARCAYCGAESLFSVRIHRQTLTQQREIASLRQELDRRQRERRTWAFIALGTMVVLAATVASGIFVASSR